MKINKILLVLFFPILTGCPDVKEDPRDPDFIIDERDGNKYSIVKIGNQTWFAENLRYSGNIPQVDLNRDWETIWHNSISNPTGQPAWTYYNNDISNEAVYGKLYNWYAVNTETLCPSGWHIPTETEWTVLSDYLGGDAVAGGKMKSVTGWQAPNTDSTNESGFTGLPGGFRFILGSFSFLGSKAVFWSSSLINSRNAWYVTLDSASPSLVGGPGDKADGQSCRCVKN